MIMPDFSGMNIVVTRPAHQSQSLVDYIRARDGNAILFPVIEIAEPLDPAPVIKLVEHLAEFDIAIFVSANAVNAAMKFIQAKGGLPESLKTAAVGYATVKALASYGLDADIYPIDRFNSEALLDTDELKEVSGKKIIIFRGDGGRELLAETLRQREASVTYAECYRRIKPDVDTSELMDYWRNDQINAIVVMSNNGLQNLWEMAGNEGQDYLQNSQLIVISDRTIQLAQQLGIKVLPMKAATASDQAVAEVLKKCKKTG